MTLRLRTLLGIFFLASTAWADTPGKDLCQKNFDSYKSRLTKNPGDEQAWTELRVCAGELKRWNEAIEVAMTVRQKHADFPGPYLILGMAQMSQRNYERAVEHFDESIRMKHDQPVAYFQMGMAYLYLNQPEEATKAAEMAVELDSANPAHHRQLAYAHLLQGHFNQAEYSAKKAIELDKDDIAAYKILSKVYSKEGKTEAVAATQDLMKQAEARYAAAHPELAKKKEDVAPVKVPEEEAKTEKEKEEDVDVIGECINQWDRMKRAMLQGDIDGALQSYSDYLDTRDQYRTSFQKMGLGRTMQVFSNMGDLYDCEVVFASAHCKALVKNGYGSAVVAKIRFEKNPDKVWRIRSF